MATLTAFGHSGNDRTSELSAINTELAVAIYEGNPEKVRAALDKGANPVLRDVEVRDGKQAVASGYTLSEMATALGHPDIAMMLVDRAEALGRDAYTIDQMRDRLVSDAAGKGWQDVLQSPKYLPKVSVFSLSSALYEAADTGNRTAMDTLLVETDRRIKTGDYDAASRLPRAVDDALIHAAFNKNAAFVDHYAGRMEGYGKFVTSVLLNRTDHLKLPKEYGEYALSVAYEQAVRQNNVTALQALDKQFEHPVNAWQIQTMLEGVPSPSDAASLGAQGIQTIQPETYRYLIERARHMGPDGQKAIDRAFEMSNHVGNKEFQKIAEPYRSQQAIESALSTAASFGNLEAVKELIPQVPQAVVNDTLRVASNLREYQDHPNPEHLAARIATYREVAAHVDQKTKDERLTYTVEGIVSTERDGYWSDSTYREAALLVKAGANTKQKFTYTNRDGQEVTQTIGDFLKERQIYLDKVQPSLEPGWPNKETGAALPFTDKAFAESTDPKILTAAREASAGTVPVAHADSTNPVAGKGSGQRLLG